MPTRSQQWPSTERQRRAGGPSLSVLAYGLPVLSLRRVWDILEINEPTGPHWEVTFRRRMI